MLSKRFQGPVQGICGVEASSPPKCSASSPKIFFIITPGTVIAKKASRREEPVSAREVSIPCLRTQLCLKMHQFASQRIFISKHFRRGMPPDPPRKLVAFGHPELLPQTINPRQNFCITLPCIPAVQCRPIFLKGCF